MQVKLQIDGRCGVHTRTIELPDEIKGMNTIVVGGISYNLFTTLDVGTNQVSGLATHFFAKDEEVIDLTGWTKEEGGFLEAKAKLAELMKEWE